MSRLTLRRIAQVATFMSIAVILYATLAPSADSQGLPDWLAHIVLFGALGTAAALWYATSNAARREPRRVLATVLVALWLFSGLTEVAQEFVPARTSSMTDLGYDVLGSVFGFIGGGALWRMVLAERAR